MYRQKFLKERKIENVPDNFKPKVVLDIFSKWPKFKGDLNRNVIFKKISYLKKAQIMNGVKFLHDNGITHCNIKPT